MSHTSLLAAILPCLLLAPCAGCYTSYARTDQRDASAPDAADPPLDDGAEATCTIREIGEPVMTGIDVPTGTHHHYDLAWADARYVVVWDDAWEEGGTSSTWFTRMSRAGETEGARMRISWEAPEGTALNPRVAWTGSMLGVSWDTYYPPQIVRFLLLHPDGEDASMLVEANRDAPGHVWGIQSVMAWTGTHFMVAWPYEVTGPNAEGIAVAVLDATGDPDGVPLTFSDGYTGHPDIQGTAGLGALLWTGESTYFTLFEPGGDVVAQSSYTDATTLGRHLAVGPGGYAVAWSQDGFFFLTLGPDGEPRTAPARLGDQNAAIHSADVLWCGWGWAVAWQDRWTHPEGLPSSVRLIVLGPGGETLLERSIAEIASGGVSEVHLAWTGSELGVMWNGRDVWEDPVDSLLLARFTCD